jgi:hypothetical protein
MPRVQVKSKALARSDVQISIVFWTIYFWVACARFKFNLWRLVESES